MPKLEDKCKAPRCGKQISNVTTAAGKKRVKFYAFELALGLWIQAHGHICPDCLLEQDLKYDDRRFSLK